MSDERVYNVDVLARVEGEGRFYVRLEGDRVTDAHLSIFEAPRYFEAFLRGRSLHDVPDIVARICGICPVAYQMSSVRALESALGLAVPASIRALRRLLYCGEWIESHVLHVYLLHAPDYLGYPNAMTMAADHPEVVERGLRMKRTGNELIEVLGGRAIHPISVRVGGFTRVPRRQELERLRPALERGLADAEESVMWMAGLEMPESDNDYVLVAVDDQVYPLEGGDAFHISGRGKYAIEEFDQLFVEDHVERSNALHCRLRDGRAYLCGPLARLNLAADKLHPRAVAALERSGLRLPVRNPYQSIVVRAVEVVHAFAEALDIIAAYQRPPAPFVETAPRASSGCGATEAPRGMLYHRYEIDDEGSITHARIVPPTSQNQARIEEDLVALAPSLLSLSHDDATLRCEQLIRAYDPCISCATHFLRLDIERR